uniref:Uncharacterized protein LOC111136944 n=1 Tax=Crassostrea virginica TaxID=6565 RepID=A0A8B8EV37_CRAVI|nr:uncharacterized protein LOC111136944 [Crassostrea virginica]XP_022343836.1 uncharacterized protein LOC111136944 [Crassostrea virginica]
MEEGSIYENVPKETCPEGNSRGVHGGYIMMTDKKCLKCQLNANPNIKCKCQEQSEEINQSTDYENMKVTRIRNMEKIATLKKQALQDQATLNDKAEQRIYDSPTDDNSGRACACCVIL